MSANSTDSCELLVYLQMWPGIMRDKRKKAILVSILSDEKESSMMVKWRCFNDFDL